MSRPPFCPTKTAQVAIPISIWQAKPCRDIKSVLRHHSGQSRSRHQNQVATLLEATLCRDINFMSRPHFCPQWDSQVVTPKPRSQLASVPLTKRPFRNLKTLVATPNLLSPIQPGRDTKKDVATPTPSSLGRNAKTMSRPRPVWPRSHARCPGWGAHWRCRARGRPCPAHLLPSCHDLNTRS